MITESFATLWLSSTLFTFNSRPREVLWVFLFSWFLNQNIRFSKSNSREYFLFCDPNWFKNTPTSTTTNFSFCFSFPPKCHHQPHQQPHQQSHIRTISHIIDQIAPRLRSVRSIASSSTCHLQLTQGNCFYWFWFWMIASCIFETSSV